MRLNYANKACLCKQGPRDWLCQTAGAAAPPGGREPHAVGDRGGVIHADLTNAYTPSFGLMGHESLIMQQSDIGAIADSVKDCLRCGKCKPVCATHVPRANLLYSPRNKILAKIGRAHV